MKPSPASLGRSRARATARATARALREASELREANALLETRVQACQHLIGYGFKDKGLIREALTPRRNQRLAIAGDKAADLQTATQWYRSNGTSGPLTPLQWQGIRIGLLCNANLAQAGSRLRILDGGPLSYGDSTIATTVEAIIGAVWFDSRGDPAALASVMRAFGLTTHPLLSSHPPFTVNNTAHGQPIWSHRPLPTRYFNGHHFPLLQLLFSHEHKRVSPTETLPAAMWSRLRSILFTPKIAVDTAQQPVAAPPQGEQEHAAQEHPAQEPRPRKSTEAPEQHASAPVPAANKQTDTGHSGSEPNGTLPAPHPVVSSGQGQGLWHPWDTEWHRIGRFIFAASAWGPGGAEKWILLKRLDGHRKLLAKLPDRSLKNIPDDHSTTGVYLASHSADEPRDKLLANWIALLQPSRNRLKNKWKRRSITPEEDRLRRRLEKQLSKIWRARLKLWLPPTATQLPTSSSPEPGPSSASPPSRSPVTPAVDSMGSLTALPPADQRPEMSDSVLWTTNVAQRKSVDWKHYLSKPTTPDEENIQSEARKL